MYGNLNCGSSESWWVKIALHKRTVLLEKACMASREDLDVRFDEAPGIRGLTSRMRDGQMEVYREPIP